MVSECSDIFLRNRVTIKTIEVYEGSQDDKGLLFRDGSGHGFGIVTEDVVSEVCFVMLDEWHRLGSKLNLRTIVSRREA